MEPRDSVMLALQFGLVVAGRVNNHMIFVKPRKVVLKVKNPSYWVILEGIG